MEHWRIIDQHPAYAVSDLGRVRRQVKGKGAQKGKILRPRLSRKGYLRVALHDGQSATDRTIHSLVIAAFSSPRPLGMEINHRDGVKANNHLDNLEYVTPFENMQHAKLMGLLPKGIIGGMAAINAAKTTCKLGHPLNGYEGTAPGRRCLICRRDQKIIQKRAYRARCKMASISPLVQAAGNHT